MTGDELTETVRERYGAAARRVLEGVTTAQSTAASCCGPVNSCCGGDGSDGTTDPITSNLYVTGETDELPEAAVLASLGCGNPTALAQLDADRIATEVAGRVGAAFVRAVKPVVAQGGVR